MDAANKDRRKWKWSKEDRCENAVNKKGYEKKEPQQIAVKRNIFSRSSMSNAPQLSGSLYRGKRCETG